MGYSGSVSTRSRGRVLCIIVGYQSHGVEQMTSLPSKYSYVAAADAPSLIRAAVPLYGTLEAPGARDNEVILGWAHEVEQAIGVHDLGYSADSIPWCGLFAGVVAVRAGWAGWVPKAVLWARAWAEFGQAADEASFGDVLVFVRDGGGHVGFYVGEDASAYHVLGGNQSDAVTITRISKDRLHAVRRPVWRVAQPESVRPIALGASGPLSSNEA